MDPTLTPETNRGKVYDAVWNLFRDRPDVSKEELYGHAQRFLDYLRAEPYCAGPTDSELKNAYAVAHPGGPPIQILSYGQLLADDPQRAPAVIDGLLRQGGIGTLIGGSKTHKSWAAAALAAAVISGGTWFGYQATQGRVLLLDGELTPATIHFRLRKVFEALRLNTKLAGEGLDIVSLRGRTRQCPQAMAAALEHGPGHYGLIIVDPLYCFYPNDPRFSENDNAGMRRVYDDLIGFAGQSQAGLLLVHHLSKGDQSQKSLTDLGAGAGTIARAGDAHLVIRPHQERGAVVFDGVVRDFPEVVPTCWRWGFPLFQEAADLDPQDIQGAKKRKDSAKDFLDVDKATSWTSKRFAERFITKDGKTIDRLRAEATEVGDKELSDRKVESLTRQAVAMSYAQEWPGKTGPNGKQKRYANVPCPVSEAVA